MSRETPVEKQLVWALSGREYVRKAREYMGQADAALEIIDDALSRILDAFLHGEADPGPGEGPGGEELKMDGAPAPDADQASLGGEGE